MFDNTLPLSNDGTNSDLYLDAIDNEVSKENITAEEDKYELHEFQSSICIWEHNCTSLQFGVYSQFLEARVVLNNNCPKCFRTCRNPEKRNLPGKKIEETILTCQIANRPEKKQCPLSCQVNDLCACGKAFLHSKRSSSSSRKKQKCTLCTPSAKCSKLHDSTNSKTKCGSSEMSSLLKDINRIPTKQKYPNKFTSRSATKSGSSDCRIPVRCGCKSLEKNHVSSSSYLPKLSYFSSEQLHLVHSAMGNKLTETLKLKQCILCDKFFKGCNSGSLKTPVSFTKCKYCSELISSCLCSKWKKNCKKENSIPLITMPPLREKLQCICEKRVNRIDYKLAGIIEEAKTKPQSISTSFFDKKVRTPKSVNKIDAIPERINEEKNRDCQRPQMKNNNKKIAAKALENKNDGGYRKENFYGSVRQPPTNQSPQPLKNVENISNEVENSEEKKLSQLPTKAEVDKNGQYDKASDIRKSETNEESDNRIKEIRQPAIVISDELKKPEEIKLTQKPQDTREKKIIKKHGNIIEEDKQPEISIQAEKKEIIDIQQLEAMKRTIKREGFQENSGRKRSENNKQSVVSKLEAEKYFENNNQQIISMQREQKKVENIEELELYESEDENKAGDVHNFEIYDQQHEKNVKDMNYPEESQRIPAQIYDNKTKDKKAIENVKHEIYKKPEYKTSRNTELSAVPAKPVDNKTENSQKPEGLKKPQDQKEPSICKLQSGMDKSKHICAVLRQSINEFDEVMTSKEREREIRVSSSSVDKFAKNSDNDPKQHEDNKDRMPDITITIEISENAEDIKYSILDKGDNRGIKSVEDQKGSDEVIKYSVETEKDTETNVYNSVGEKEESGGVKEYSRQEENINEDMKYSVPIVNEDVNISEFEKKNNKICICHIDELPKIISRKCRYCKINEKNRSRIPIRTSKLISKSDIPTELIGKKICHFCNISTNTETVKQTETVEQCEGKADRTVALYKKCGKSIDKTIQMNDEFIPNQANGQTKLSKFKATGCTQRSSTFVCSNKRSSKLETAARTANICSKYCQRPSTASKLHERKTGQFDSKYKTRAELSGVLSSEEAVVRICQPCSELLPLSSEKVCPRGNSSDKDVKISHCHTARRTDQENFRNKIQGCIKKNSQMKAVRCKQFSQTGGTFEQDMIASYVASCSSNAESPPPEQFIIQTLLYQFAGNEPKKNNSSPRRRNSQDISRGPQLREPSKHDMRSIQVQVGSSYPSKCETAQTVTTFILTDPRTVQQSEATPTVEGKINYICGPDIPGIRTKVAMNLNQIPSVDEADSHISNERFESYEECAPSALSCHQNENVENAQKPKPNFKVTKNEKYVFITITPVQTEPYEPNYYIIFTKPEDEATTKKETKNKKISRSSTKPKVDKSPHLPSTKKSPLECFKNQIFSFDTLKSCDFLDYFEKRPDVLQNTKIIGPSCDPSKPMCLETLLEKTKEQKSEPSNLKKSQKKDRGCGPETCERALRNDMRGAESRKMAEDKGCGPDTCEYFEKKTKNYMTDEVLRKLFEDKECGPDTCEYLEAPHENRQTNGIFENRLATTATTVSNYHQQDEMKEIESRKVDASTNPLGTQGINPKDIRCRLDTCDFKKQEDDYTNDKTCVSTQTEEISPTGRSSSKPPRAMLVVVGCDVCTVTDMPHEETISPKLEYCDKQICTNECEKGDVASQVCIEKEYRELNDRDNLNETIRPPDEKIEMSEMIPKYCDSSCSPGGMKEEPRQDEVSCASNCDPSDCDFAKGLKEQKNIEQELEDLEECSDKVCPEKTLSSVDKLHDERVSDETEKPHSNDDCGNSRCSKKTVNTKLDDQDVFALKLAMDRFIKMYFGKDRSDFTMNTGSLQEVLFRKVDHHETLYEHLLMVQNNRTCRNVMKSSSEDIIHNTISESISDVSETDSKMNSKDQSAEACTSTSEMDLKGQSSEAWTSVSENEVYFQKLNARIVFPEGYKYTLGRKEKKHAFKIENFFEKSSEKYSNLIRAIKTQQKCQFCIRKDERYCQDESKVLLTALARNFFLSNGLQKNSIYPSVTGSRKTSKEYSEQNIQSGKYKKHENFNNFHNGENKPKQMKYTSDPEKIIRNINTINQGEVQKELFRIRKIRQDKKQPEKTSYKEEVKEELIQPKKVQNLEKGLSRKPSNPEIAKKEVTLLQQVQKQEAIKKNDLDIREESIKIKKIQQLQSKLHKKVYDRQVVKEESINIQKTQLIGNKSSNKNSTQYGDRNIRNSLVLSRNAEIVRKRTSLKFPFPENITKNGEVPKEALVKTIEITSLTDLVGPIREKAPSLHEVQEKIIQKRHVKPLFQNIEPFSLTSNKGKWKKSSKADVLETKDKKEKFDIAFKPTGILNKSNCSVDASSSMPLKTFQSFGTGPKSITKTSICLQSYSKRGILKTSKECSVNGIPYPIGDSNIINTYQNEIVYTLDKVIEEIQRLKLRKNQCKTKKVCFVKDMDTQTNQKNQIKKYSTSAGRKYFTECSYDNMFEEMDNNEYIQMLLRSKMRQLDRFHDFI